MVRGGPFQRHNMREVSTPSVVLPPLSPRTDPRLAGPARQKAPGVVPGVLVGSEAPGRPRSRPPALPALRPQPGWPDPAGSVQQDLSREPDCSAENAPVARTRQSLCSTRSRML